MENFVENCAASREERKWNKYCRAKKSLVFLSRERKVQTLWPNTHLSMPVKSVRMARARVGKFCWVPGGRKSKLPAVSHSLLCKYTNVSWKHSIPCMLAEYENLWTIRQVERQTTRLAFKKSESKVHVCVMFCSTNQQRTESEKIDQIIERHTYGTSV